VNQGILFTDERNSSIASISFGGVVLAHTAPLRLSLVGEFEGLRISNRGRLAGGPRFQTNKTKPMGVLCLAPRVRLKLQIAKPLIIHEIKKLTAAEKRI
jgi:hypothetical protein